MDKNIIKDLEMYIPPKDSELISGVIVHEMIGVIARAKQEIELRDAKINELETGMDKLYNDVMGKLDNVDKIIKEVKDG